MLWRIGEILVQKKLITWDQLEEALAEQERTKIPMGEILMRRRWVSKSLFYRALAKQHKMKFADPARIRINPKAAGYVPKKMAYEHALLPLDFRDEVLFIGVSTPTPDWPAAKLKQVLRVKKIKLVLCLPEDIQKHLLEVYPLKLPKRGPTDHRGSSKDHVFLVAS